MSIAATDTTARKSADEPIVSGGRLVAKAPKNEGVDAIFTLCGGHGEEVRDPGEIGPALRRAREAIERDGKSAVVDIRVDPGEYAPGTKAQTMYE